MMDHLSDPAACRKKLAFQAGRRSTLEMDRIMGLFLEKRLAELDGERCRRLLALLASHPDSDLHDWISGLALVPPGVDAEAVGWIAQTR